jgi:hypothetical protein
VPRHRAPGAPAGLLTGRRPAPAVVAAVVLVLIAVAALSLGLSRGVGDRSRSGPAPSAEPSSGPGTSSAAPSALRPAPIAPVTATATLVDDLQHALARGDVPTARSLAGSAQARRLVADLARNATRLGVVGLHLRPLAQTRAPSRLERRYGPGTWVSEVEVAWRYADVDDRLVTSTAQLVLTAGPDGVTLDDTRPALGEQTPPWLLEPLEVRRRDRVLVAAHDAATAARLVTQAVDAVAVVGRRLPGWRGSLVVEAPGAVPVFRAATGLGLAAARSIAAVTTTADGSTLPGSPERVFVNPRVFDPLSTPAQGIVLRHEATHVAVAAAASAAPLWLTEGFADWVALADTRVPVRVLASQALALVRDEGAPRRLPGRAAFAAGNPDLGAAYESSWLAVRLLARTYGAADLLRFQRLADRDHSTSRAFRVVLGTSEPAFTRAWRRELVRLAT